MGFGNYICIFIMANKGRQYCNYIKNFILVISFQLPLFLISNLIEYNIIQSMSAVQFETINRDQNNHAHSASGKCVCEACNCGRHKCPAPHKKGDYNTSYNADYHKHDNFEPSTKHKMIEKNFIFPEEKFSAQSSYTGQYNKKGGKPTEKFVPKGQLSLSKDPFQANSSYIQDYLNRGQPQRAEKMQLPKNFVMPQGKFDGNSNYTQNYIKGKAQRQEQFRPVGQLKVGGNFQGTSSYNSDFENKGTIPKAEKVPQPKNHILPEGKFDGSTNYTMNYLQSRPEKLTQFKPEGQLKVGGTFEGASSYGNDYQLRSAQRAQRYPLPMNQVMPDGIFQGSTNYNQNYINSKGEKSKQIKHDGQLKIGGDFQGQSSYLAQYSNKGNAVRAERVPLPKNQVLPEGKFHGDSSYTANYIKTTIQKRQQFRPEGEIKLGGDFQGVSSYFSDFDNKGQGLKSQRIPLPKNHVMPDGKFEGNSAYNSDYINSKVDRVQQYKPTGQLKVSDGKFQATSSYSNDYLNKGSPVRADRVQQPKNQILPEGKFDSNSTYNQNYQKTQVRKENCPCESLKAPKYQKGEKDHIKYNQKNHQWE